LRLPGAWDGFEVAVRVLVARDVGAVGAAAVMGKLAATYGQSLVAAADHGLTILFPTAAALTQAPLANLGLSRRAAHGIQRLAHAVIRGDLRFDPRIACVEGLEPHRAAAAPHGGADVAQPPRRLRRAGEVGISAHTQ
jgi:3-methyladenine DNA glycosylase/8-oxoguanine DNA glycosylase